MPTYKDFLLPDLGEGLTEGEILTWLVAPGDEVRLNQPIVEVETAKAAVEIPSPYAGTVTTLHHVTGETVDVGSPIITFDTDPGGTPEAGLDLVVEDRRIQGGDMVPEAPRAGGVPVEPGLVGSPAPKAASEEKISVLVGTGPKSGTLRRRARKPVTDAVAPAPVEPERKPPARVSAAAVAANAAQLAGAGAGESRALAKPPVRKLARDLGVDLESLSGSGEGGAVTRDDVESAARDGAPQAAVAHGPARGAVPADQRIPVTGVRRATASAMVASAFSAPHVTEFVTVDVTPTMQLVQRLRLMPEFAGVRVSPLLLVARALLLAVRRHPMLNSSWDDAAQEIVVSGAVNLGIAAATPRGLIVPNIKDAGSMSLPELAGALDALVATAKAGRTTPADMQRGTITITNVGVFGVDTGTPILNPGEAAILCFGAVRSMPWVHEGQVAVRQVTQLALSFDHRIVDGQLGSEFLADVAALLADPTLFAVWA
jgi:pyruvate dehydrogenase E2 component (dihydrolipoamide acetyltransferase)